MPNAGGGAVISSSGQIADDAITSADIKDGDVADVDISATAAIAASKVAGDVETTGAQSVGGVKTFTDDPIVPAEAYGTGWNGSNEIPTKNDVYDKLETVASPWTTVKKTADESVASDTTLSDDNTLVLSVAANTNYVIRGLILFYAANATPDFKFKFAGPTIATQGSLCGRLNYCLLNESGATTEEKHLAINTYASSALSLVGTDTGTGYISFEVFLSNEGNAGTFSFQWAQVTSDVNNTTVRKGSYLEYMTLA